MEIIADTVKVIVAILYTSFHVKYNPPAKMIIPSVKNETLATSFLRVFFKESFTTIFSSLNFYVFSRHSPQALPAFR